MTEIEREQMRAARAEWLKEHGFVDAVNLESHDSGFDFDSQTLRELFESAFVAGMKAKA